MTDFDIDQLVRTAVFGDGGAKADARRTIHLEARRRGAVPSSVYPLYMAMGRGEVRAFTVPAFNIRALTYDAARALFRAAMRHGVGAFIRQKHWGCDGTLVLDARIKPHHAPPLEEDPAVTRRVEALAAPGGPLHRII